MNNNYLIKLKKAELEILDEIDRPKRAAYTYCYGIDRPKLDLFDICQMLKVSENVVKIYINQADEYRKEKTKMPKQKQNFLEEKNQSSSFHLIIYQ